jgi:phenylalanyl-tRNA synthetase beta chain
MKLSFNLLKKFIDIDLTPQEAASTLASLGIETSVISSNAPLWSSVVVAKILNFSKHPNADKLSLCSVSDGTQTYSIVCGAQNLADNKIVALAKIGAVLPGEFQIKKSKIRGIESEGMLCSESELGLAKNSEGILGLDPKTKLGIPLEDVFKQNDSILEVEITPNRGDCLSHLGIARELAAKLNKSVHQVEIKTQNVITSSKISVKSALCPRYIGAVISDIVVEPSPAWLVEALEKCSIRSINNIVDITNYVMIELGQPLHAFDITKLKSETVIVRTAQEGENILALDAKEYKLEPEMLVIADEEKPVAIAGVMGGEKSGIDKNTKTIFLESAIFNPSSIRKTSKKLKLTSESSYRYERGIDIEMTNTASWRAINLILTIVKGSRLLSRTDSCLILNKKHEVILRHQRIQKVLGFNLTDNEVGKILRSLGIDLQPSNSVLLCKIPYWRNDIKDEIDLIEEIARVKGYDNIPALSTPVQASVANNSFFPEIVQDFRKKLYGLGFCEAVNYSFCEIADLERFGIESHYKIINPASKENEVLRPSLLPALYRNLLTNIGQGASSVSLFEYGKIYDKDGEKETFAILMSGNVWKQWWNWENQEAKYNFHFAGGIVQNILPAKEFFIMQNVSPASYFHPGKTAAIVYHGKPIGQFGAIKPSITQDLKDEVFYCEINIEPLKDMFLSWDFFKSFSRFPSVKRDISLIAGKNIAFEKIEKVIKNIMKSGNILKAYNVFSVYDNAKKIGKDKIGYSLRLTYRNSQRTLTDKEVSDDTQNLLEKLNKDLGITLRT